MCVAVCVVIPVYNHASTLRDVVMRAHKQCPHVIVVDDGSTDGANQTIHDLPITLVRLEQNQGKGQALWEGMRAAEKAGFTHMITLDADGQHYPEDIPRFITAVQENPEHIIIGARDFSTPNVPRSSQFGRAFSGFWMRVQTGLRVADMQSGFRAYPLFVFTMVKSTERRYAFETELVVRAAWAGTDITEIPIQVLYQPKGTRISHFHAFKDNMRMTILNTRLTTRALIPLPFSRANTNKRPSLRHPLQSLRLLMEDSHNRATPAELAKTAAIAMGILTLPIPFIQSILLLLSIGWFRLNRLCALSLIPLSWPPFLQGTAVLVGYRLRHGTWLTEFSLQTLGYEAGQRLWEWVLGSLFLAPCLALVAGSLVGTTALLIKKTSLGKEEQ